MKQAVLFFFLCLSITCLQAQNISVKSFRAVPDDMTVRVTAPVIDQNGDKCALIKVRTSQKGFVFEGDMNGITKTKQDVGEVWVYLPQKSRKITIKHQQLGVLDKYIYPEAIKEASVYIMELTCGKVTTIVENVEIPTQWLIITSEPEGANIYLNEEYKGVTTFQQELTEGLYSYRLEYPLYHNSAGKIEVVAAEGKKIVNVKLKGKFGDLKITSQPESGARVFLDGKDTNEITPCVLRQVSSGNHSILLQREWYKPYNKQFVIEDEQMTDVLANLQANYCSVQVTADHNAQIVVDGSKVGATSWNGRLLSGFHSFEAKKENFHSHKMKIDLVAGKEKIIKLSPKAILGNLKIMTTPFDAKIKLNDKNYGTTPNTIKDLLIGDYSMELSKAGYGNIIKTITIKENEITQIGEVLPSGKEIWLTSIPSGSNIFENENFIGRTPYKGTFSFGKHRFRIHNNGLNFKKEIIVKESSVDFSFDIEKHTDDFAYIFNTSTFVNLNPSSTYSINPIRKLYPGNMVEIINTNNENYYKVRVGGDIGYVYKGYLSKTKIPQKNKEKKRYNYNSPNISYISDTNVNLNPSSTYSTKPIRKLKLGTKVEIINTNNENYYKVSVGSDIGYVYKNYLSKTKIAQKKKKKYNSPNIAYISNTNVNLNPSSTYSLKPIRKLNQGTKVEIINTYNENYYKVRVGGDIGYVYKGYLSKIKN